MYRNPVAPGFRPDPSAVRVGDDYFMVNSTFHYVPGIAVSHSRDLVHWRTIGHVFTDSQVLDFRMLQDSRGFWAPDISYHQGLFYIFVTLRLNEKRPDGSDSALVRRQMVVTSPYPEGPYSDPTFIDVDGIDPSHFVDDDGSHYMLLNPGATLVPLNGDCSAASGPPVRIWEGSGGRAPEGPHVLKKDGWYHLIMAEGGTGYGHQIASGRSRSIYGPYESNPHNPLLKQLDPRHELQRAGHGKFIQDTAGDWWVLYLCGRPLEYPQIGDGKFCILGRETALEPLSWDADSWPIINEGRGPSEQNAAPKLPEHRFSIQGRDEFDAGELGVQWYTPRNPDVSAMSLTERPGFLRMYARDGDLDQLQARPLLRRQEHVSGTATAAMEFVPGDEHIEAGLVAYYDTKTYIKFCRSRRRGNRYLEVIENRGQGNATFVQIVETDVPDGLNLGLKRIYLRIQFSGLQRIFLYSYDMKQWQKAACIEDCFYLSDEGYAETGHKRFTGAMLGMYAYNGGSGPSEYADFDWFDYSPVID